MGMNAKGDAIKRERRKYGPSGPVAGILCGRIPAKQREPDIDSAKRISSGLPKKGGNAALLKRK